MRELLRREMRDPKTVTAESVWSSGIGARGSGEGSPYREASPLIAAWQCCRCPGDCSASWLAPHSARDYHPESGGSRLPKRQILGQRRRSLAGVRRCERMLDRTARNVLL